MEISYKGFLDKWGMVGCNRPPQPPEENTTDNGLLFTSVALQSQRFRGYVNPDLHFAKCFDSCFVDGTLRRNPDNLTAWESHDNYTGCALGSLITGDKSIPRKLLWSLVTHLFYINGAFLGRFPQIPLLLLPAAFPFMKWVLFPFLYLFYKLQNPVPSIADPGGTQLKFVVVSCIDNMFPERGYLTDWLGKLDKNMGLVFFIYYGPNNPIAKMWE